MGKDSGAMAERWHSDREKRKAASAGKRLGNQLGRSG